MSSFNHRNNKRTVTTAFGGRKGMSSGRGGFDDDDDDDDDDSYFDRDITDRAASKRRELDAVPAKKLVDPDDDEIDPLDAFMSGIDSQVKSQQADKPKPTGVRDDLEEEDNVEGYYNHMLKQGIDVSTLSKNRTEAEEDANSDEEVYKAAKLADAKQGVLDDDGEDNGDKRSIDPLPVVDHFKIEYTEFAKNLYDEHPEIAKLTEEKVTEIRKQYDMRVTGIDVPKPCISFAHFGLGNELIRIIAKQGFTEPTGIQKQAIPIALSGRDLIGVAKTGSGKTAAFIWPLLIHLMDQPELEKGDGPIGLILAPTRELATQIYTEAKKYAKAFEGVRVSVLYGGASKHEQFKELRSQCEILVATPGRLIDLIKMKATNLKRVTYLILDEADRMFDLGFSDQCRSICNSVRPDRQTLLFSATMQSRVEKLAREVLNDDPVRIVIGGFRQSNTDVTQFAVVFAEETQKWGWLVNKLASLALNQPGTTESAIIFVGKKAAVDELTANLKQSASIRSCAGLHGDMGQGDRDQVIHEMKTGKINVLVCTDVAARGLDIKSVKTVINFDVSRDIDSHIHRIGRTGRAGEKGVAFTLLTPKEERFAAELVPHLQDSNQFVSEDLMNLARKSARFNKNRGGGRGDRGGIGSRGGGGGGGGGGGQRGRGGFNRSGVGNSFVGGRGGFGQGANSIPVGGGRGIGSNSSSAGASTGGSRLSMFQRASTSAGSSTSFVQKK